MSYTLTIDTNLMDSNPAIPSIGLLKRWKDEGRIVLVQADRGPLPKKEPFGFPGVPREPQEKTKWSRGAKARSGKITESGKATFTSVASVLFPHRDHNKLSMTEINNVVHLINHHLSKNEIFVTANLKSFIEDGRRDRLKEAFGVIAMTPDEAVNMLSEMEGWKVSTK